MNSPLWLYCLNTAPHASRDASVSSIKGFVLSGTSSIDGFEKRSFNVSNACCASLLHSHTALTCLSFSSGYII